MNGRGKRGMINLPKKGMRKKHCEAVHFMQFGSIHFYSIKKITLDSLLPMLSQKSESWLSFWHVECVCAL